MAERTVEAASMLQHAARMKRWLVVLVMAGCTEHGSGGPTAAQCTDDPPASCGNIVDDQGTCPSIEELCSPTGGGPVDCCFCEAPDSVQHSYHWNILITDCPTPSP